jgi:hypothetical protein
MVHSFFSRRIPKAVISMIGKDEDDSRFGRRFMAPREPQRVGCEGWDGDLLAIISDRCQAVEKVDLEGTARQPPATAGG